MYGGIPVFVDIDEETFCLDPLLVRQALTPKTKAIIAVNLFGHPAPLHQLRTIADEAGIILIEDNAQGPFACEYSRYAGTIGHIGVFSLNYHKHIHTGEGGICVTDSDELYMRLLMIRNHGENVIEATGTVDLTNLVGANYRMTELSAAVGSVQLEDAHEHVAAREALATALSHGVRGLEGLRAPVVRSGCRHVYYVWAMRYDQAVVGVPRDVFAKALAAEGFPCRVGYLSPLYLLPVFQQRIAIGSKGFPFTLTDRLYEHGMCPVTERMENEELIVFLACTYTTTERERGQLVEAIQKVYQWRHELRAHVEKPLADAAIT
jgi:dTDP-4-amino-4,6-dideoxygalactose transaminase